MASRLPHPRRGGGGTIPGWLQRAVAPFKPMLRPLARKVGLSPKLDAAAETILLAQIEAFKPDLILNQDAFHVDTALMRRIKGIGKPILIGQVGIAPSRGEDWTVYDLMLSQLSATVELFRRAGVRAEVNHLAFEPAVLDALPATPAHDIDISFVGTVSPDHRQRIALLEAVAARHQLALFGNPPQALPASSPLHRCFRGEVWGADMYQALRRSKITLNSHIDMAGREAGNMRLFEATGVGAFLLTDFKDNLHTPVRAGARGRRLALDRRVPRRDRPLSCRRGRALGCRQGGTSADHGAPHLSASRGGNSWLRRWLEDRVMKLPRLVKQIGNRVVQATPILRRHILTSTDYKMLGGVEEAREVQACSPGWLATRTVARQERAYRNLIADMKRGEPRLDFSVAGKPSPPRG